MANFIGVEKNEMCSELSEMARTLIKKIEISKCDIKILFLAVWGGGFWVLACADTLERTPLGMRQYFVFVFY